jgi:hypothetical protein
MDDSNFNYVSERLEQGSLSFLELDQVLMIDEALSTLGDYGEIKLIVEKGRLRFIVTQKSFDALKWQPGTLGENGKRIQS